MKKLYITTKAWSCFGYEAQQKLTKQYDVIFTDHKTTREKIRSRLSKINRKSLDHSITKLNHGIEKFSGTIAQSDQPPFDENRFRRTLYGEKTTDISELFWGVKKPFKL